MMMRQIAQAVFLAVWLLAIGFSAQAQADRCAPGTQYVETLNGEGSFNRNYNGSPNVVLPAKAQLDTTYHQPSLKAYGGGSDSRSTMSAAEVPAGIFIAPYGTEDHEKGWAVHSPSLTPATWTGNTITAFKFTLTLYCTVGSNEADRVVGGCNVKVPVCIAVAKPAAKKKPASSVKKSDN